MKKNILFQGCTTGIDMIFAGIYKNELSVINVFRSIQCFCLNISEMNRIESTSYSVLTTRGISREQNSSSIKLAADSDSLYGNTLIGGSPKKSRTTHSVPRQKVIFHYFDVYAEKGLQRPLDKGQGHKNALNPKVRQQATFSLRSLRCTCFRLSSLCP